MISNENNTMVNKCFPGKKLLQVRMHFINVTPHFFLLDGCQELENLI